MYLGIAPVTERSGKSLWVHWRWACPKFRVVPATVRASRTSSWED
jgi:hypothetical protein